MKANKAIKRLTHVEDLLSDVMERYSAGGPDIKDSLQSAKAAGCGRSSKRYHELAGNLREEDRPESRCFQNGSSESAADEGGEEARQETKLIGENSSPYR